MTYAEGIIQLLVELAPSFVVVGFAFIVFAWLRLLFDVLSGRDW